MDRSVLIRIDPLGKLDGPGSDGWMDEWIDMDTKVVKSDSEHANKICGPEFQSTRRKA